MSVDGFQAIKKILNPKKALHFPVFPSGDSNLHLEMRFIRQNKI